MKPLPTEAGGGTWLAFVPGIVSLFFILRAEGRNKMSICCYSPHYGMASYPTSQRTTWDHPVTSKDGTHQVTPLVSAVSSVRRTAPETPANGTVVEPEGPSRLCHLREAPISMPSQTKIHSHWGVQRDKQPYAPHSRDLLCLFNNKTQGQMSTPNHSHNNFG